MTSSPALRCQAGTNYNAAQQAQNIAVAAGRAEYAAMQAILSGRIKAELGPLPGDTLAGTTPDCPGVPMLGIDDESKEGHRNEEVIRFDPNYRAKLIKNGFLCADVDTGVDPRLEMVIVLGVILQEVHNAGNNVGPWTEENVKKWERDGHLENKRFLEAMKGVPELIEDPVSREKLCHGIERICDLIERLS